MRLSILVVSRTPSLLNQMLESVAKASSLEHAEIEILCSWNGATEAEQTISNTSGYEFLIAQREPYHFASNMNRLAEQAEGELLLLINDDVVLDAGSIDAAINCLEHEPKAGLVGGRLRNSEGELRHAGILFDSRNSPYHQLDRMLPADATAFMGSNRIMPAVTGALMLIRRQHFLSLLLNEKYKVCGEDVELCLDLRQRDQLEIWYCPEASGIHEAESTRQQESEQEGNTEDLCRIRRRRRQFIEQANNVQLCHDLLASSLETESLRILELQRQKYFNDQKDQLKHRQDQIKDKKKLKNKLKYWQDQSHSLQLTRLRQQQELEASKRELSKLRSAQSTPVAT